MDHAAWFESLAAIVGPDYLLTDDESRTFYSTDVYRQADELAAVIVQPGSVDELQAVVKVCAAHKTPMVVRGGGASYTDGYLPTKPGTVLFDVSRLTGINITRMNIKYYRTIIQQYSRGLMLRLRATPYWFNQDCILRTW